MCVGKPGFVRSGAEFCAAAADRGEGQGLVLRKIRVSARYSQDPVLRMARSQRARRGGDSGSVSSGDAAQSSLFHPVVLLRAILVALTVASVGLPRLAEKQLDMAACYDALDSMESAWAYVLKAAIGFLVMDMVGYRVVGLVLGLWIER